MVSDCLALQLHDRATRGEQLSVKELAKLADWYALQDRAENNLLGTALTAEAATVLRGHIVAVLDQLMVATKRMQEIAVENETLRGEIAALRRQLVHAPAR